MVPLLSGLRLWRRTSDKQSNVPRRGEEVDVESDYFFLLRTLGVVYGTKVL